MTDFNSTANYMEASLLSFQNLSTDDKKMIGAAIDQYRTITRWPDTLKGMALGYVFLTIAGEDNFDIVIENMKQYANSQKASPKGTPAP